MSGDLRLLPPVTFDVLRPPPSSPAMSNNMRLLATSASLFGDVRRPPPPSSAMSSDLRLLPPATSDVWRPPPPSPTMSGDLRLLLLTTSDLKTINSLPVNLFLCRN
ncbi:hypothetical protein OSB04_013079 [Centaurea solstitialis]|uniref:Uncharacterized protein n=1 Tax=Centaurea solstitialis TaxID=347529 RepID=A0AA38TCJ2_9ASTR|nr:hypothetical protein OSB04_013079 [Centaurea solstitialis]